jgi:hypothetical protein
MFYGLKKKVNHTQCVLASNSSNPETEAKMLRHLPQKRRSSIYANDEVVSHVEFSPPTRIQ